jgi:hypothetical protein
VCDNVGIVFCGIFDVYVGCRGISLTVDIPANLPYWTSAAAPTAAVSRGGSARREKATRAYKAGVPGPLAYKAGQARFRKV